MQNVLYVSDPRDLKHFHAARFERVYLGCECCHWLMPDADGVRDVLRFCAREQAAFSLVTPTLTPVGYDRVTALLDVLPYGTEVIANDFGLLPEVTARGLVPVAGRLLIKARRDPRIRLDEITDEGFLGYLRRSNLDDPGFQGFLREHGVARAELDNLPQGWSLTLPSGLHTSLYYPFVNGAVTRRCSLLFGVPMEDQGPCRELCGTVTLRTRARLRQDPGDRGAELLVQGGLLFFENDERPADTTGWNLDRLVFMPRPPAVSGRHRFIPDWEAAYERHPDRIEWGIEPPDERLLALVDEHRPCARPATLDLGCGNGRNAEALQRAGYLVTGIDQSPSAVSLARARACGATFLVGSAVDTSLPSGSFGVVIDSGCLHAIPPASHLAYAAEVARLLRAGGVLVLFARTRVASQPPERPVFLTEGVLPEWGFTTEQLVDVFGPQLALVESIPFRGRGAERFAYWVFRKQGTTCEQARDVPHGRTGSSG